MTMLKRGLLILFYPSDGFVSLKKERGSHKTWVPFVMILLAIAVRIASIFITHFPLASILPKDANIYMEVVRIAVPVLLTVISCYLVTTIMSGSATFEETLIAGGYALMPYIIFTIPLALLTHIWDASSAGLYRTLGIIIWIWVFILFFIAIKDMNEYEFSQALLIVLLTVLTIAIIVALALLFFGLTAQIVDFIKSISLELRLLLMEGGSI